MYRTPLWLTGLFIVLLAVFAITPDPAGFDAEATAPTSEPTAGPRGCVVCPIDQECDPDSGQCMFIDHTPLPCVKTAKFDDEAGFCLPEGAPPPPPAPAAAAGREPVDPEPVPGPDSGPSERQPGTPRREADGNQQQDLPGFGD